MTNRKKAIVTGGSSGIGRGIVRTLASEGYDVAFSYCSNDAQAAKITDELKKCYPGGCFFCERANLVQRGEAVRFFRAAVEQLGGLDLLVNNAGVTRMESIFALSEETMDEMIGLDFRSYLLLMREGALYMARHEVHGSIINITSTRAGRAYPGDGLYGGIKAGIERATKSAALDAAPWGIRINCVAPGATQRLTPEEMERQKDSPHVKKIAYLSSRIPLERYGTPEDIAQAVLFLASERAAYITGVTLAVDGGLTLPGMPETKEDEQGGWGAKKGTLPEENFG